MKKKTDARKDPMGAPEALEVLDAVTELWVAKGKKVTNVKLGKNRPDDDELLGLMLGPTGNLRAPTLRRGKKLIVGFNADIYQEVLG